jgi:FkbM family methyltransferase
MGSFMGQALLNSILAIPEKTPIEKLMARGLNLARKSTARIWDPIVTYKLDGFEMRLPLSHDLPTSRKRTPDYSTNVGRIAAAILNARPDATAIDIGANIGDTAAIIRSRSSMPVLCVEPDPKFSALLQQNIRSLGGEIIAHRGFISTSTTAMTGTLRSRNGTAQLTANDTGTTIETTSVEDLLQLYPRFQNPGLLKTDTDGFDVPILRGMLPLLSRIRPRPVLFFEYDPQYMSQGGRDGLQLLSELQAVGYSHALVYDNLGDLLVSVGPAQPRVWEDLHEYFSGRQSQTYMDVCLFPNEDAALCDSIRDSEHRYFALQRSSSPPPA